MTWIDANAVKKHSGVPYTTLGFSGEEAYSTWITGTLLVDCESIIEDYCQQEFADGTVSATVKFVCKELAARVIQSIVMHATSPIRKIDDYRVEVAVSEVFGKDLKDLLEVHVEERPTAMAVTSYKTDIIKATWDE